jgi:hypothetical protein
MGRAVLDELTAAASQPRVRAKKKSIGNSEAEAALAALPKRRVRDGQRHIKGKVLRELDSITDALVERAKSGGTSHLRLLWDLGKLHQDATATSTKQAPSLSDLLMREIKEKRALKRQSAASRT